MKKTYLYTSLKIIIIKRRKGLERAFIPKGGETRRKKTRRNN